MRLADLLAAGGWLLALVLIAVIVVQHWAHQRLRRIADKLAVSEYGARARLHESQRENARLHGMLFAATARQVKADHRADACAEIARSAALLSRLLAPPTGYDADIAERHQA